MKRKVRKSCVTSAMLYGSEAWYLKEKEMEILTERAIIRAMFGLKLLEQKNSDELMNIKESSERIAKAK